MPVASNRVDRSLVRRAGQWFVYTHFRILEFLLRLLPLPLVFLIGEGAGLLFYLGLPGYRKLAVRNMTIAFGRERTPEEIRSMARASFLRLGGNLLSSLVLPRIGREAIDERVEVIYEKGAREVQQGSSGVIFCIPHMGAWELFSQLPELFTGDLAPSTMYQTLRNPFFDAYVRRRRATMGLQLFDRGSGFRGPMAHVKAGGALGILTDQHAGDHGVWAPLFGRLASTTSLPAILAGRTGAALVPLHAETVGRARWRLVCGSPVPHQKTPEKTTAVMNLRLGEVIGRSPEDWFWVHNRWKTPKPNFLLARYRRGIFLPDEVLVSDLQPFEILVRSPNWLGDICMAIPAVRAMQAGRPDARITVLSPARFAPVWNLMEEVAAVLEKPDGASPRAVGKLIKKADTQFDVAVLFPNSLRSALEAKWGNIPRIVGFAGHHRAWVLDQIVPHGSPKKPPEHQTQAAHGPRALRGSGRAEQEVRVPLVGQTASHRPEATAPRRQLACGSAVCPGAAYGGGAKRLPTAKFAADHEPGRRRRFPGSSGCWSALGTGGRRSPPRSRQQATGRVENLAGKTGLEGLIQTLAGSAGAADQRHRHHAPGRRAGRADRRRLRLHRACPDRSPGSRVTRWCATTSTAVPAFCANARLIFAACIPSRFRTFPGR